MEISQEKTLVKTMTPSQISSSSRRSFLMGLTLAEIMLILLFCILLVTGALDEQRAEAAAGEAEAIAEAEAAMTAAEAAATAAETNKNAAEETADEMQATTTEFCQMTRELQSQIAREAAENKDYGEPKHPDTMEPMTEYMARMILKHCTDPDAEPAPPEPERTPPESPHEPEQAPEPEPEIDTEPMPGPSPDAEPEMEPEPKQENQRAGTTPPCLHKTDGVSPPPDNRGKTVPLGLIRIKRDSLSIEQIYFDALTHQTLVDYEGQPMDVTQSIALLSTFPDDGRALTVKEFRRLNDPIKQMADRMGCMFTMDYIMKDEDFVPLNMFTKVFQGYYLPQSRLQSDATGP